MKVKTLSLLAGAGSLLLAGTAMGQNAPADFVGIEAVNFTDFFMNEHPNANVQAAYAGAGLQTWRVYAVFTGAAQVHAHGGKLVSDTPAYASNTSGSFFNVIDSGHHGDTHYNLAPTGPQINGNPSHAFDSFITLGQFVNPSAQTSFYGPEWGAVTGNMTGNWVAPDSGITTLDPNAPHLVASQSQQGLEDDGLYRVLLYQHSFAADASGVGSIGVIGGIDSTGASYEIWDIDNALAYSMPAPGALALLGLAGLAGTRRRRA